MRNKEKENVKVNPDGTKVKLEASWFKKGNKLLITGHRRGTEFIPRKYSDSVYKHTIQLIKEIDENGELVLQSDRVGNEKEEERALNYDR